MRTDYFFIETAPFYIHLPAMYEWSSFSASLPAFGVLNIFLNFGHSNKYLVISHRSLICISAKSNDVEHPKTCLFVICISLLVKCLFKFLLIFKLVSLLSSRWVLSFYILRLSLCQIWYIKFSCISSIL